MVGHGNDHWLELTCIEDGRGLAMALARVLELSGIEEGGLGKGWQSL